MMEATMSIGVYKRTEKCNEIHSGWCHSQESRKKMRDSHLGINLSEEHRKRMSEAKKGNKNSLGRILSEEHKRKIGQVHKGKLEEQSGNWKGDKAKQDAMHAWVYRRKGRPKVCEDCGATNKEKKLEWANKDHTYKRILEDYISRCVPCHREYDIINN